MVRWRLLGWLTGVVLVAGVAVLPGVAVAETTTVVSEAEASRRAADSGVDVVASALTTDRRLVTAHPDGSFTQEMSLVPERVKVAGTWRDTDSRLIADGKGRLVPAVSATGSSVSGGGTGALVRVTDGDRFFELGWPGGLPSPVVDGSRALYANLLPGVDLVAVSSPVGFSTYFVVKDAQAAAALDPGALTFTWAASPGLSIRASATTFQVVDEAGVVVFDAPALAMWDSADVPTNLRGSADVVTASGDSQRRPVGAVVSGNLLVLAPDQAMLADPATVFPVIIDPAAANPTRTNWLMVWSNGLTFRNSATENARVGYDGWEGFKTSRAFYQFELAGLKGKNVTSAVLTARQVHSPSFSCRQVTTNPGVQAYRTGSFTSTTTWSSQPTWAKLLGTNTSENGNSTTCGGYLDQEWNVLTGVKDQLATSASVVTLGLKSADESNRMGWRQYDNTSTYGAAFPKLVVEYFGYTTTPTGMAFKQGDGNNLIQGRYIKTQELQMSANVVRPDGYTTVAAFYRITRVATNHAWTAAGSVVTGPSGVSTLTTNLGADGEYKIYAQTCVLHNGSWTGCSPATALAQIERDTVGPATPRLDFENTQLAESVLISAYWYATVTANDTSAVGLEYQYLGGPTGQVAFPAGSGASTLRMAWATPQVSSLRVRSYDSLGNFSPWTTEAWVKIHGSDPGLKLYRYEMSGNGQDTGVQPTSLKRHLAGNNLNTSAHFPHVATSEFAEFCTPVTNQVFSPNGEQGVYMRQNLGDGAWTPDKPFAVTALVKPSAADIAAVQSGGHGTERVYVWGVTANADKTTYIMLVNDGGVVRWKSIINGIEILGSEVQDEPNLGVPAVRWYAIGLVLEAGAAPVMHINGDSFSGSSAAPGWTTAWIGVGSVSTTLNAFSGQVDEFTVWTNGLTQSNFLVWASDVPNGVKRC